MGCHCSHDCGCKGLYLILLIAGAIWVFLELLEVKLFSWLVAVMLWVLGLGFGLLLTLVMGGYLLYHFLRELSLYSGYKLALVREKPRLDLFTKNPNLSDFFGLVFMAFGMGPMVLLMVYSSFAQVRTLTLDAFSPFIVFLRHIAI